MMEIWKRGPFHEEYEVSNFGRVRSMDRYIECSNGSIRRYRGRNISLVTGTGGYQLVTLYRAQDAVTFRVHRLVLAAFFVGPVLPKSEGCHNDGNPSNNSLSNLRWDSRKGNFADKKAHGTENSGSRNGSAKLTESDVIEMRNLRQQGACTSDLSMRFGVSRKNVQAIVAYRAWKHIGQGAAA